MKKLITIISVCFAFLMLSPPNLVGSENMANDQITAEVENSVFETENVNLNSTADFIFSNKIESNTAYFTEAKAVSVDEKLKVSLYYVLTRTNAIDYLRYKVNKSKNFNLI